MICRDKYFNQLIDNKDNGFPKVVTGVRRCGKSYLLKNIYKKYLLKNGIHKDHILIIELDDYKNSKYRDPIELGTYIKKQCKNKSMYYVFLDEVQEVYSIINPNLTNGKHVLAKKSDKHVIGFVDVILGLSREKNIDLYVTGSNSKMLSTDIVTEFRDKSINIHLAPLSFEEFHNYKKGNAVEDFYEYMQFGGMPLTILKKSSEEKKEYLKDLFETTYFKDILEHNKLKRSESLDELCNIISEQTGQLLNSKKIADTYRSVKHKKIDEETVEKYINYFKDSFLLKQTARYDIKGRSEIGALRKYYFVDTGLRNARLNFVFPDEGQMLENIIYNELIYNGYSVSVGTFDNIEKNKKGKSIRKTYEIDFFANKDNKSYYIQICNDISNKKTRQREISPYILLNDEITKIIVINKPINENKDENGFTIIGVIDFLLKYIK